MMRGLDNFKTVTNEMEATKMWFLQRMLQNSWITKKSNKTMLREADTTISLINRIHKLKRTPNNPFWPCDEN